jgi:hypothetical protein
MRGARLGTSGAIVSHTATKCKALSPLPGASVFPNVVIPEVEL